MITTHTQLVSVLDSKWRAFSQTQTVPLQMALPLLSEFLVPFACLRGDGGRNTCREDIVKMQPPPKHVWARLGDLLYLQ